MGSIEKLFCVNLVMTEAIAVDFFDGSLRPTLSQFQVVAPGLVVPHDAVHREFDGDSHKVAAGTRYTVTENGKLQIRRETFVPEPGLEVAGQADVSSNYEAVPEFGKYEAFMRMGRQLN